MSFATRSSAFLLSALVLSACGDDDGNGPDEFDPSDLIGTYALSPAPEVTCDLDELGTATLTIDTVEVTDADEDGLSLRLPILVESDIIDRREDIPFTIAFDPSDRSFGGSTILDIDVPATITTIHGDGELSLDGDFDDSDSFNASIVSDVDVAVGDGTPVPCSSLDIDVTGTRT